MAHLLYRYDKLQTYYVGIGWQQGGTPEIRSTLVNNIAEMKLTEKGYFIYSYEILIPHSSLRLPYPPFGEVVDYAENNDGTITLYIDGVWPDYNSDYAFTNIVVVQPFEDGTFRYLSNAIEKRELEIPIITGTEG